MVKWGKSVTRVSGAVLPDYSLKPMPSGKGRGGIFGVEGKIICMTQPHLLRGRRVASLYKGRLEPVVF